MNRIKILGAVGVVLLLILIITMATGGRGGRRKLPYEMPKAVAYECTKCTYKFGVPLQAEVWPPLKCPKCSGEAVQATILQPVDGGEPQIVRYERFTRRQVEAMRKYRDSILQEENGQERLNETPPEVWLTGDDTLGGRWIRYALVPNSQWISPQQFNSMESGTEQVEQEIRRKYKIVPVFPKDWPIEENVESAY